MPMFLTHRNFKIIHFFILSPYIYDKLLDSIRNEIPFLFNF